MGQIKISLAIQGVGDDELSADCRSASNLTAAQDDKATVAAKADPQPPPMSFGKGEKNDTTITPSIDGLTFTCSIKGVGADMLIDWFSSAARNYLVQEEIAAKRPKSITIVSSEHGYV